MAWSDDGLNVNPRWLYGCFAGVVEGSIYVVYGLCITLTKHHQITIER